ncbi:hypothetical protein C9374_001561 [Naegleria lovaniensis]|uniref:F-box domain-containing protein n=1 Tax=Naegleria lovaniensis TaxID=51637 RepID=A0AA88GWZ6_NAELO|nr:uncharacterized protein C9374_001561 [Naegleria lovaniensis]KAG2387229.1 hypothetical protein C9374_001561 [Naegleria lovaniensis]
MEANSSTMYLDEGNTIQCREMEYMKSCSSKSRAEIPFHFRTDDEEEMMNGHMRVIEHTNNLGNLPMEMIHYICRHLHSDQLFRSLFVLNRHWYECLRTYPTVFLRKCRNSEGALQVLKDRFIDLRFLNLSGLELHDREGNCQHVLKELREAMNSSCKRLRYFRISNCLTSPVQKSAANQMILRDIDSELGKDGYNWFAQPSEDGNGREITIEISTKHIETVVFEMLGQISRIRVVSIEDQEQDRNCNLKPNSISLFISRCRYVSKDTFDTMSENREFCERVAELMLEWNIGVDDLTIESICRSFPNIEKLSVANCVSIGSAGFGLISSVHNLRSLVVVGTKIKDEDLIKLSSLPNLKAIDLTGTKVTIMFEESYMKFVENCPQLEELSLSDCNLSDATVLLIKKHLKQLRKLDLSWNVEMADAGMDNILGELPRLEQLTVISGAKIEHAMLLKERNAPNPLLPHLKKLCLGMRNFQSAQSVSNILQNAPNLTSLLLSGCSLLTSDSFEVSPANCSLNKLKEVHLMRCRRLDDSALDKLLPLCITSLDSLLLQKTKISKAKIEQWKHQSGGVLKKIGYPKY